MRKGWMAILSCAALAACGRSAAPPAAPARSGVESPEYRARSLAGYDVVIVAIDGLRADRVDAGTTPFLVKFTQDSMRFENAAANSSYVLQSLAALLTGRLPTAGGTIGVYEAEPHDQTRTLAQYFEQAGYYTGMLANQPAIQGGGFTKGFQEIDIARPNQPLDDARLVERAKEFLEDAGDDRVFLYVHFAGPLASRLYDGEPDAAGDGSLNVSQFAADYAAAFPPSPERVEATVAEYDRSIRAADAQLKSLVDAVTAAGRADRTMFAVTSLNGFELFEHGGLGSGWTVYEEAIRVPLVLHAKGALPHATIAEPVSLIDVMPAVIALLAIGDDGGVREGRALFEPRGDALQFVSDRRPRIAEVIVPERCIVRSITDGGLKYIAASLWPEPATRFAVAQAHRDTANAYLDGSKPLPPLWGADAYEALYDLKADPGEKRNIAVAAAAPLQAALDAYRQRCAQSGIRPRVATQFEATIDPDKLQNLESLGYL